MPGNTVPILGFIPVRCGRFLLDADAADVFRDSDGWLGVDAMGAVCMRGAALEPG